MAPRVVLVTDPAFGDDAIVRCVSVVAGVLPRGAFAVQLRDKRRSTTSLRLFAMRLRRVTRAAGAYLVVNGDAIVARDADADGVHLGGDAVGIAAARVTIGRRTWVSAAAHSDDDVRRAREGGADAVLVSPVFTSRPPALFASEKAPRGLAVLRSARAVAAPGVAVYALGGIGPDGASLCAAAGADGVAVIRALLASDDPAKVARALYRPFAA